MRLDIGKLYLPEDFNCLICGKWIEKKKVLYSYEIEDYKNLNPTSKIGEIYYLLPGALLIVSIRFYCSKECQVAGEL